MEAAEGKRDRERQRHVDAADTRQPGEVQTAGENGRGQQPGQRSVRPDAEKREKHHATESGQRGRQPHPPGIDGAADEPGDQRDEPVIQRRLLQFEMPIEKLRNEPVSFVENHLRVLGRACFVAAGQVMVAEADEEEDAAEGDETERGTGPLELVG